MQDRDKALEVLESSDSVELDAEGQGFNQEREGSINYLSPTTDSV